MPLPGRRPHARTDGQPENIVHPAVSVGQAVEAKQRNLRVYVPDYTKLIRRIRKSLARAREN